MEDIKEYVEKLNEIVDKINEIPCQSFRIEDTLTYDFGIQTRNSDGTFRTMCEVLDDASKVYCNLDDTRKNVLRELIFGGHCSKNRFEEYMSRWNKSFLGIIGV